MLLEHTCIRSVYEPSPNQQQTGSGGRQAGMEVSLDVGVTKPERSNGLDKQNTIRPLATGAKGKWRCLEETKAEDSDSGLAMTWRRKRCSGLHRVFTGMATAKVAEVSHNQRLTEAVAKCMVVFSAGRREGLDIPTLCT